ncbi:MAG: bacteriocin [Deltaproteobacteria bacterium]|nr:bacteriocin [Deltaproteobacteria bacterium]
MKTNTTQKTKRLKLSRETLKPLNTKELATVAGGSAGIGVIPWWNAKM